jgi:hypothetical protein
MPNEVMGNDNGIDFKMKESGEEERLIEKNRAEDEANPYEADPFYSDDKKWAQDDNPVDLANISMRIRTLLRLLSSPNPEEQKLDPQYNIFITESERNELYEYSSEVTRYLHDEQIADLVIIDRSSRPLYIGVIECWRSFYPGEARPGIYFLNPKGFKATKNMSRDEIYDEVMHCLDTQDNIDFPSTRRGDTEIDEEFAIVYTRLVADKDKPILVFDSCIHSGHSLLPVKESMDRQGFSDVRIGAINPSDYGSAVNTDFFITQEKPTRGCYPFDHDRSIEKTFDHVYSTETTDPQRRNAAAVLRKEIKRIVRQKAKEDKGSFLPSSERRMQDRRLGSAFS